MRGCSLFNADIKEMLSSGLSLMPDGLEAAIAHQDLADLIAFLQAAMPTTHAQWRLVASRIMATYMTPKVTSLPKCNVQPTKWVASGGNF